MKKVLLVYYSFTGEARRVVDIAAREFSSAGHEVSVARVDFAGPKLQRPLSLADVKRWTGAAEAGERMPVAVEPADALAQRYDLVCIFSNTWQHHPCVPIRSLLAQVQMQAALKDTPFAVYVVCRRSWEKNLEIVRHEAEQSGGRFVAGERFQHIGSNVGSLVRTVSYLLSSGSKVGRLFGFIRLPLPEYGLSGASLARAASFTKTLAAAV